MGKTEEQRCSMWRRLKFGTKYSTETVTQLKQPGASHASYLRSQKSPQVYGALMVLYWQLMNHKTVNLWKSEGEQWKAEILRDGFGEGVWNTCGLKWNGKETIRGTNQWGSYQIQDKNCEGDESEENISTYVHAHTHIHPHTRTHACTRVP